MMQWIVFMISGGGFVAFWGKITRLVSFCFLCGILILLCSACGFFGEQRYFCDANEVESVQIVRLDRYVEGEYRYEYSVLAKIADCTSFVSQLNRIKHTVNWGDPYLVDVGYIVIRIEYHNGDYDLIHKDAQWFHRSGENNGGDFFFDDEQFDSLISAYISDSDITEKN